jgi:hypothetical protein
MRIATITITPEVESVLRSARVEGNQLQLRGQLDRKLYEAVNKVVEILGGKWNRGKKAHIFPGDFKGILDNALGEGAVVDKKKTFQLFETPEGLADELVGMLCLGGAGHRARVLEPSAGKGRLLDAVDRHMAANHSDFEMQLFFCEIQDGLAAELDGKKRRTKVGSDFLQYKPGLDDRFDRVIMNPPFTGGQDVEHVMHAYNHCLRPNGRIAAIVSASYVQHTGKKFAAFRKFLEEVHASEEKIPAGAFKESGTDVPTMMVVIDKPGAST